MFKLHETSILITDRGKIDVQILLDMSTAFDTVEQ